MQGAPAQMFVSHRGSRGSDARRWADAISADHGLTTRIVPDGEYAYERECVTRQQMWEVVARILHEITSTGRVAIFRSVDYFDSFWTCSELLTDPGPPKAYVKRFDHKPLLVVHHMHTGARLLPRVVPRPLGVERCGPGPRDPRAEGGNGQRSGLRVLVLPRVQ
jgi:hypothetical protein